MSQIIDNNGRIYESIRDFCRKTGCGRRHVMAQISIEENTQIKLEELRRGSMNNKTLIVRPRQPLQIEFLQLIAERYSEEELKSRNVVLHQINNVFS